MRTGIQIPDPSFCRIDYARPDLYLSLDLPETVQDPASIRKQAQHFTATHERESLSNIRDWLNRDFQERNVITEYGWRTVDEILNRRTYIGCADYAMVFGVMARACGIPLVWVKTMDCSWIRQFATIQRLNGGSGHVFVEVYLERRWRLIDASQGLLYREYYLRRTLFPGSRYGYDKGGDPYELVLSLDWEPWKEQTQRYFSHFDLSFLSYAETAFGKEIQLG